MSGDLLKGKTVLIVDDERDVLETLEDLLSMCEVVKASTFEEAKLALETQAFDIAVLDIMGVDGYKLLDIARNRKVIPVMLTDPRDEELADVGLASFEDLESGQTVLVDTSDPAVRAHYARYMRNLRGSKLRLFKKLGLDHCVVRTDESYVRQLHDLFARRARRIHR